MLMDTRRALAHIQRATELLGFGSSQSRKGASFGVVEGELNPELTIESLIGMSRTPHKKVFELTFSEIPPTGRRQRIALERPEVLGRLTYTCHYGIHEFSHQHGDLKHGMGIPEDHDLATDNNEQRITAFIKKMTNGRSGRLRYNVNEEGLP